VIPYGTVLSPYLFAVYIDDIGKLCNAHLGLHVVLYADDILLLASSVVALQRLLHWICLLIPRSPIICELGQEDMTEYV